MFFGMSELSFETIITNIEAPTSSTDSNTKTLSQLTMSSMTATSVE